MVLAALLFIVLAANYELLPTEHTTPILKPRKLAPIDEFVLLSGSSIASDLNLD